MTDARKIRGENEKCEAEVLQPARGVAGKEVCAVAVRAHVDRRVRPALGGEGAKKSAIGYLSSVAGV